MVKKFEIDFVRRADRHNVPSQAAECLANCVKTHFSCEGSVKIAEKVKLSRSKINYISKHGIARTYFDETLHKLHDCDGFLLALMKARSTRAMNAKY